MTPVIRFGKGDRGRSKCLEDFTRERHWVQGQGPASKVRSLFEGAGFSRSAHLGKARGFLRRCAPFSKVRTEKCASSSGDGNGHRFRPARNPCLAVTKITSRSGLDASERI